MEIVKHLREIIMPEKNIWRHDSLSINEKGEVEGGAYTSTIQDGYDIQVAVFSYTYERDGEIRMNHVPNVVLTDSDGTIVAEPHSNDSEDPMRAIENAKGIAEYVWHNPEDFI